MRPARSRLRCRARSSCRTTSANTASPTTASWCSTARRTSCGRRGLWWMLHWAGHQNVTLLEGGYTQWIADGRPIDTNPTPYPTSNMTVRPRPGLWATREEVLASIGDGAVCTINALSPDVYAGTAQDELRPARTHSRQQKPLLRIDPRRTDVPQRRRNRRRDGTRRRHEKPTASSRIAAAEYPPRWMRSR